MTLTIDQAYDAARARLGSAFDITEARELSKAFVFGYKFSEDEMPTAGLGVLRVDKDTRSITHETVGTLAQDELRELEEADEIPLPPAA